MTLSLRTTAFNVVEHPKLQEYCVEICLPPYCRGAQSLMEYV